MDLQTQLVDALSHRTGVRVAVTSDQSLTPTYLLRGRVRISGHFSRFYLSMVAVESGETFWTETLDDEISDVFAFLDRTTEKVAFALRTHFNTYAGAAYAARPDHELNTQQLLSKAAHLIYRFDAENAARSQVVMEAALQRSPESAIVLAMYSYTWMQTVPLAIHRADEIDRERASLTGP